MTRCTVCDHPDLDAIDEGLVGGLTCAGLARRFGLSRYAINRHKLRHLPKILAGVAPQAGPPRREGIAALARAEEQRRTTRAADLVAELQRVFERANLLFDACDRWLRDPDDPQRYEIGPRAEDLSVVYTEPGPRGAPVRKKARLSYLLAQVQGAEEERRIELVETKHADPRELILKAANTLREQLELLARLLGELREGEAAEVNILLTPGWLRVRGAIVEALDPYPKARYAVAARLDALDSSREG
jgi:hypothetical protein